jgi:hypothetical protein
MSCYAPHQPGRGSDGNGLRESGCITVTEDYRVDQPYRVAAAMRTLASWTQWAPREKEKELVGRDRARAVMICGKYELVEARPT